MSDIPPALSLGAPAGAVVRNGPILLLSIREGSFFRMRGTVLLLQLQPREDLNPHAPFRAACPGQEALCSLLTGVKVKEQPEKKGKNDLVVTLHSPWPLGSFWHFLKRYSINTNPYRCCEDNINDCEE